MRTIAFCEIDPFCRAVLKKHWPQVPCYEDVTKLTAAQITDRIDVICGGFPCQDISVAGKGAGIEGSRSGLWSEYARIIGEIRPRWVIIENVSALLSGSDEYELPNDRCLCGWPYRWRGMHQHSPSQQASILSASGCGDGIEGTSSIGSLEGDLRRFNPSDAPEIGEVGRSAGLASVRQTIGSIPESHIAASSVEAGTCTAGIEFAEDDRLSAEEAEWFRFVDGESDQGCESYSSIDDRTESQGAAAFSISRMVCEACGRDLGDAATRSGHSTWMGRILRDLAQVGPYDVEFHCIPASAVGAPHRRDRIWIVAYRQDQPSCADTNGIGPHRTDQHVDRSAEFRDEQIGQSESLGEVENPAGKGRRSSGSAIATETNGGRPLGEFGGTSEMAYPDKPRLERRLRKILQECSEQRFAWEGNTSIPDSEIINGNGSWQDGPQRQGEIRGHYSRSIAEQWLTEPDVGRVAHGIPARVDRLRSLGNAIVPQIAEIIGRAIMEIEGNDTRA